MRHCEVCPCSIPFFGFLELQTSHCKILTVSLWKVVTVVCSTGWFCYYLFWCDLEAGSDWFVWAITTTDFAWLKLWYVFYLLLMGHAAQTLKIKQQPPKAAENPELCACDYSVIDDAGWHLAWRKTSMEERE